MLIPTASSSLLGGAAAFNPQTDITWHSLFWAEGTDFVAQGYSDTDAVTTWPNETSEIDLTAVAAPAYDASNASFNGQPAVVATGGKDIRATSWTSDPSAPVSMVLIGRYTALGNYSIVDWGIGAAAGYKFHLSLVDGFREYDLSIGNGGAVSGLRADTNAHLLIGYLSASGNEKLDIDGTNYIDAALAASLNTSGGPSLFTNYFSNQDAPSEIVLFGIYEGDFTADSNYGAFKTWVTSHYGITLA